MMTVFGWYAMHHICHVQIGRIGGNLSPIFSLFAVAAAGKQHVPLSHTNPHHRMHCIVFTQKHFFLHTILHILFKQLPICMNFEQFSKLYYVPQYVSNSIVISISGLWIEHVDRHAGHALSRFRNRSCLHLRNSQTSANDHLRCWQSPHSDLSKFPRPAKRTKSA